MGKASRRRKGADQGSRAPRVEPAPFVPRPFEGLPGETDWVAMREILPAATAAGAQWWIIEQDNPVDPIADALLAMRNIEAKGEKGG
jgi:hypothetical protein